MNELLSISPIDGRYHEKTKELADFFSEYALIKYRINVEIKWLLYIIDKKIIDEKINKQEKENIVNILNKFKLEDAIRIKEIEKTTRHDVKACEYFLQEKFKQLKLDRLMECNEIQSLNLPLKYFASLV